LTTGILDIFPVLTLETPMIEDFLGLQDMPSVLKPLSDLPYVLV
jgi:hypothetical protein